MANGVRYRLIPGEGGGAMVGPGTPEELVDILRRQYGARLLWVELPDGSIRYFPEGSELDEQSVAMAGPTPAVSDY